MRGRRRLVIVSAVVLAVALVAAVALPMLLDVERFRGRIEQALREKTGWEPELGAIDFSVFGGLVLTVSPVSLTAPEPGSAIEIESLRIEAELGPLFRGELVVRSIDLRRPSIALVRPDEDRGWALPLREKGRGADDVPVPPGEAGVGDGGRPEGAGDPGDDPGNAAAGGMTIRIDTIRITDGTLRLEDRAAEPAVEFGLENVDAVFSPESTALRFDADLLGGDGSVSAEGTRDDLVVELTDVPTEALAPWAGGALQPGGTLSGRLDVGRPFRVKGALTARQLLMLAGERPLDTASLDFELRGEGDTLVLDRAELRAEEVRIEGGGSLTPDLALDLRMPEAPLDPALRAARAVFPFPLELESPGTVGAEVYLRGAEGEELTYTAEGQLTAAGYTAASFLPPARDLRSAFRLEKNGSLVIDVLDGRVAGGPLKGRVRLDSVSPPRRMTFEGTLLEAAFGPLVRGFVGDPAERITGPSGLDAKLALDLTAPEIDARSLSGSLGIDAREVSMPGWDLQAAIRRAIEEKLGDVAALATALDPKAASKLGLDSGSEGAEGGDGMRRVLDTMAAQIRFDTIPWELPELRLTIDSVAAAGAGSFDPLKGTVRLRIEAEVDAQETAALVGKYPAAEVLVGSNGRLRVPLQLDGPLLQPKIGVDLGRVKKSDAAKKKLKGLLKGLVDR